MVEPSLLIAVGTMLGVYALIATERLHRTSATMFGVAVLFVFHFIVGAFWPAARIWHPEGEDADSAVATFHAIVEPIDLNVVFLLFGMMVMVAITARTRVFQWFAFRMYKGAKGRPLRLLMFLCLFTAVASAFIDNVTTMLLVTPVTIELALVLGTNPLVFLMPQIFASNIGGALTLVGDPPNILVGSFAGLTFMDFIVGLTPAVGVSLILFFIYVRVRYGRDLKTDQGRDVEATIAMLEADYQITSKRDVTIAVGMMGFVVLLFLLHGTLHMEVAIPALIGAGLLILFSGADVVRVIEDVEWPTLLFFMMLFVLVGAVEATGALTAIAHGIADVAKGNLVLAMVLVIWSSAILSAIVDNIPFTATMMPVIGTLTAAGGAFAGVTGLWWALVFGADLGGNATLVGASANIVTAGLSERAGHPIGFVEFMKHGIPVTLITCVAGTIVLVLEWGYLR